jgi:hypothetical protein
MVIFHSFLYVCQRVRAKIRMCEARDFLHGEIFDVSVGPVEGSHAYLTVSDSHVYVVTKYNPIFWMD